MGYVQVNATSEVFFSSQTFNTQASDHAMEGEATFQPNERLREQTSFEENQSSGPVSTASEDTDEDGPDQPTTNTKTQAWQSGSTPAGSLEGQRKLPVDIPSELQSLFDCIQQYSPVNIEPKLHLKPFIPEYIPAVGGVDEFIKIPRPDGKADFLGLQVLDEPGAEQSDPAILSLRIRRISKAFAKDTPPVVGFVGHNEKQKVKKIEQWIHNVNHIHKIHPAASVIYNHPMPDIETLLQEWPPELEEIVRTEKLPPGDLDIPLEAYVRLICNLLDIPVYDYPIDSLHVLFSLFLEFQSNPFFSQQLINDSGSLKL